MTEMTKEDRVNVLVAICVKNNRTPNDTGFADLVIRACSKYFHYGKRTARTYIDILISTWRFDKWKDWVKNNPMLTPEEKERWLQKIG